jgi:hypothetical protein
MTHTHQLALAASEDEIDAAVVRFVSEGRAAEEPTVLSVAPRTAAAVQDRVGTWAGLTVLSVDPAARRPGTDLAKFTKLAQELMAAGTRVRVVNEIPQALCRNWGEWRRYEAVVNVVHAGLNLWGLCLYDERQLSPDMVEDLRRTHPFIGRGVDARANRGYQEPRAFCDAHFDAPPDPLERSRPALDLRNPSPAAARAGVRDLIDGGAALAGDDIEALVLAAHEAVTNAAAYGRPPVTLRGWVEPRRVVVTVTDMGQGPQDSFLGLIYSPDRQGMWLSHQLVEVSHRRDARGYTVRMTAAAGQPVP